MRSQSITVQTGKTKKLLLICITMTFICGIIALIGFRMSAGTAKFVAPALDINAKVGMPSPEQGLNFGSVTAPTGFSVGLCGTMYQQEDGSLIIYLTNPETNDVNILCEIKDEEGNVIYKSGVIQPGEYLESLYPLQELVNQAMPIEINIYGYEKESWYSRGTILMENILQPY